MANQNLKTMKKKYKTDDKFIKVNHNGIRDILKGMRLHYDYADMDVVYGSTAFVGFRTSKETNTLDNVYGALYYFAGFYEIVGQMLLGFHAVLSQNDYKEIFQSFIWLNEGNYKDYGITDKKELYFLYSNKFEKGNTLKDYICNLFLAKIDKSSIEKYIDKEEMKGNFQIMNNKIAVYNYRDFLYSFADYAYIYNLETDELEIYRRDFNEPQYEGQQDMLLLDSDGNRKQIINGKYMHLVFKVNRAMNLENVVYILQNENSLADKEGRSGYFEEKFYDTRKTFDSVTKTLFASMKGVSKDREHYTIGQQKPVVYFQDMLDNTDALGVCSDKFFMVCYIDQNERTINGFYHITSEDVMHGFKQSVMSAITGFLLGLIDKHMNDSGIMFEIHLNKDIKCNDIIPNREPILRDLMKYYFDVKKSTGSNILDDID